ncbi:MAG TPA: anti-sigma factor [Burkholderiales bacterium]|nr:anti-sigma factor [Burkholderiales bacterium]
MSEPLELSEAELQAFVDGRLDPLRRAAVEAWLLARPEEAERLAAYRRLSAEVRSAYQSMLDEPVPERLTRFSGRRAPLWRYAAAAAWLALGVAIGAVATLELKAARPGAASLAADSAVMARRAAIAHATYSPEVRHPVEVGAADESHLVAWLSKRLGIQVKVPKLADAGMALVGGRLLPGETGPVAQFMYQTPNGRRLTLYVRQENAHNTETAFRYVREHNVGVFYWIDRNCGYAIASSDLSRDELLKVADLVYKQLDQ